MSVNDVLGWQGALFAATALIVFLGSAAATTETTEKVLNWLAGIFACISFVSFLAAIWMGVKW